MVLAQPGKRRGLQKGVLRGREAKERLDDCSLPYNTERTYQALGDRTAAEALGVRNGATGGAAGAPCSS